MTITREGIHGRRLRVERTRWGLHVRLWLTNDLHAGWSRTFGWHIKIGRFVRARSYA